MDAIRNDMNRVTLDEPGVTIDARALVPPTLHRLSIHSDDERVQGVPIEREGSDVHVDARIAAPISVDQGAVQPDRGVSRNSIQLDFQVLPAILRGQSEVSPIPTNAPGPVALGDIRGRVKGTLDSPVMRQIDGSPSGVVVVRRSSARRTPGLRVHVSRIVANNLWIGNVAKMETPSFVKG